MKKRLMMALAAGALVAAMVPGAASADTPEYYLISFDCGYPAQVLANDTAIGSTIKAWLDTGYCTVINVMPVYST